MDSPHPRLFILHLVLPGSTGKWLTAVVIAGVLLAFFYISGVLTSATAPRGVLMFFVAILAYIVPIMAVICERCRGYRQLLADTVLPGLRTSDEDFDRQALHFQLGALVLGVLGGTFHMSTLYLAGELDFSGAQRRGTLVVMAGSYLVWLVVSVCIATLFRIAFAFAGYAREIDVDLYRVDQLAPFARVAAALALALVGAQAALPLMLIQGSSLVAFVPGWLGLFIPMLMLMAIPVWPVHQAIGRRKAREIGEVDAAIAQAKPGAGGVEERASVLGPLLAYRREILAVREWPFDPGFYGGMLFYILIPPLTWVGAALIENLVDLVIN